MRRLALGAIAAGLIFAPGARAADSLAPPGAPAFWLPNVEWVNRLWLPYDEQRLYRLLGVSRGEVFRWVRVDASNSLAELGERRGYTPRSLALALVAPRKGHVSERLYKDLLSHTERTLTQPHMAQHFLFHALHQTAISSHARQIFGVPRQTFFNLRRAELSPLQIGALHDITRVQMLRRTLRALRASAAKGVRSGNLLPVQARSLLARQARQVPRWLAQTRYNGPGGGRNKPDLPPGNVAKHATISADGRRATWDAYRSDGDLAEHLGEIFVRGAVLSAPEGEYFSVSPKVRYGARKPHVAYNSVLSADGSAVAFETAETSFPLSKRIGQMSILVRDLRTRNVERVSHAGLPRGAPTRTAFNPSLSGDGRLVAFEATDSGHGSVPARSAVWVYDRLKHRQRLVVREGESSAAFVPRLAAGGTALVYTAPAPSGETQVWLKRLRGRSRPVLLSRAGAGSAGDGDSYEPAPSADGSVVAFTSSAQNLGARGRHTRVFVRDVRRRQTVLVSGAVRGAASQPAISADGRFVAFVERTAIGAGRIQDLRSRVWLFDRARGTTRLVSRRAADGYNSEPAVSAGGRRVVFTSTAGYRRKPAGLAGIFVRDMRTGTTRLLSGAIRRRARATAAPAFVAAPLSRKGLICHLG